MKIEMDTATISRHLSGVVFDACRSSGDVFGAILLELKCAVWNQFSWAVSQHGYNYKCYLLPVCCGFAKLFEFLQILFNESDDAHTHKTWCCHHLSGVFFP